jgi:DNA-binding NarL/FixJ family response regulator
MRSNQSAELKRSSPVVTEQERALLTLSCRGLSNREIADHVALAESTVKKLLHQSSRKLGATSKGQAFHVCLRQGIINVLDLYPVERLISCYVPQVPEKMILTRRERQMLTLAARGLSNQEIAENMLISVSAVKSCLSNAFGKLGAPSRGKAVWLAHWQGFLNNLDILSPEDVVDIVAASGLQATKKYLELLEKRLDELDPTELSCEPYISNIEKLNRFRDLLRQRLVLGNKQAAGAILHANMDTRMPACGRLKPHISAS